MVPEHYNPKSKKENKNYKSKRMYIIVPFNQSYNLPSLSHEFVCAISQIILVLINYIGLDHYVKKSIH